LLSERERPTDVAQHADLNHDNFHTVALAATAVLIPCSETRALAVQPRVEAPPPPPRTLALKGPSLRRPPPALVA
jgi:hypothetical protein